MMEATRDSSSVPLAKEIEMKRWWWSKTIYLAALQLVTGFVEAFYTEYPPELGYALMIKSVIDVILRAVTSQGVE